MFIAKSAIVVFRGNSHHTPRKSTLDPLCRRLFAHVIPDVPCLTLPGPAQAAPEATFVFKAKPAPAGATRLTRAAARKSVTAAQPFQLSTDVRPTLPYPIQQSCNGSH